MNLSVVIPVYNEADILNELCEKIAHCFKDQDMSVEVIFVDDGSTDDSCDIIRSFQKKVPFIKLVQLVNNFGQEQAIFAGFRESSGELIATMDGDLQIDPADIMVLLEALDDTTDIVCGKRNNRSVDPLHRNLLSSLFNKIMNTLLGTDLEDFGSNFRIYRKHVVECVLQCSESFLYTSVIISWLGFRVKEVPIPVYSRKNGDSKYDFIHLMRIFLYLFIRYSTNIFQIFGVLSLLVFFAAGCGIIYGYITSYISLSLLGICGFFWILMLLLFVEIFFIGEYLIRIYSDVQFNPQYIVRKTYGFK